MCRYAFAGPYKRHCACFTCRKAFKQPPIEDWLSVRGQSYVFEQLRQLRSLAPLREQREEEFGLTLEQLESEYFETMGRCPECGEPMADLGLDFKPLRQSDVKAWRILQGMYRMGHVFLTCGCDGPGYIPTSKADYRHYLEERLQNYRVQLANARESTSLSPESKQEAVEYWTDLIGRVETERSLVE